jgi:hypothetical protein
MTPIGTSRRRRPGTRTRERAEVLLGSDTRATPKLAIVLVAILTGALTLVSTGPAPSMGAAADVVDTVIAWGSNDYGQSTVPAAAQSDVTQVAGGVRHSLALRSDGSVVAWGGNDEGQTTVPAGALVGVTQVSAGSFRSLALSGGGVVAWGLNPEVPIEAQSSVTQIAAGAFHNLALKSDGSVVAWGNNVSGQSTVPIAAQSGVTQVAASGYHSLALKSDGSVVAWGDDVYGQSTVPIAAQSGVTQVAAGSYHSLALKSDGSVIAWGRNNYGQSSVPDAALSGVTQIAAHDHSLALKSDGSVIAWGRNDSGQATVPAAALGGVTQVAAGAFHTLALAAPRATVSFAQAQDTVPEDAGTVHLRVARGGNTAITASVHYARTSGTATRGADFVLDAGTLTFSPGQTSRTIPVTLTNDTAREGPETIVVSLTGPGAGTALGTPGSITLTINASDQQPDALISTSATSGYVGNDIYNTTGAGQTRTATARRTKVRTFYVRVTNDGNTTNTFRLTGSAPTTGSSVRYHSGTTDITTQMRSATGYRLTLPAGGRKVLRVTIAITRSASIGSTKTATVRATWTGDGTRPDAVKATVRVVP